MLDNIRTIFKILNDRKEQKVARNLFQKSMTISTAESCTGGLLSSRLTDVAGSSTFIKENFITYANSSKVALLNVSNTTLNEFGAVSEQCAKEMAEGLFQRTDSDIVICTTGIAGPTGAEDGKPIGTIYISIKNQYKLEVKRFNLNPKLPRIAMKYLFTEKALEFLLDFLDRNYSQIKF